MLEPSDKKFVVKTHLLISSLIALVAVGLLFVARPLSNVIINFLGGGGSKNVAGDTPVVIIGGSLDFKATLSTPWTPTTPGSVTQYSFTPASGDGIETITVKRNYKNNGSDDGDPTTDLMGLGVTDASTWNVIESTTFDTGTATTAATSIAFSQSPNQVVLTLLNTATGFLCLDSSTNTISYGQVSGCSDAKKIHLSVVNLTASDSNGSQATGTFNCIDTNGDQGKCRVVFRGPVK